MKLCFTQSNCKFLDTHPSNWLGITHPCTSCYPDPTLSYPWQRNWNNWSLGILFPLLSMAWRKRVASKLDDHWFEYKYLHTHCTIIWVHSKTTPTWRSGTLASATDSHNKKHWIGRFNCYIEVPVVPKTERDVPSVNWSIFYMGDRNVYKAVKCQADSWCQCNLHNIHLWTGCNIDSLHN